MQLEAFRNHAKYSQGNATAALRGMVAQTTSRFVNLVFFLIQFEVLNSCFQFLDPFFEVANSVQPGQGIPKKRSDTLRQRMRLSRVQGLMRERVGAKLEM